MENSYGSTSGRKRLRLPKQQDIRIMRFLIICGTACLIVFAVWFFNPAHIGYPLIYWPLTFALLFKLFKMLHEWYHYWHPSVPARPQLKTKFTADVLTTACPGEPQEMIIRTIKAMVAIRYPHTSYLCDEGNDPILKKACEELGVIHVTRTEKINAKAGNINNALKQSTGDICVILDPDHVPVPEFLDRVLPYFENEKIGYVQCVQAYGNQSESFIARAVAEQSYHFYGPMMMTMNSYGTAQAIGANCSFRRKALESIGGHAPGLAEDMHTAMQLQAKGWESVYVPEILTRGLVPATLSSYYKQQLKWSRGCFELLFRTYPSLFSKFTLRQKYHHFAMPIFFLFGLVNFIDILIPVLSLVFAQVPWEVEIENFAVIFLALCGLSMVIRLFAQRWLMEDHEKGLHLRGGMLRIATWWIYLVGFVYAIFNINVPYIPTPKEDVQENYWKLSIPNILVALICTTAIIYGLSIDWTPYSIAMASYAGINIAVLGIIVLMSQQKFMLNLKAMISRTPALLSVTSPAMSFSNTMHNVVYSSAVRGPVALLLAVSLLFVSYNIADDDEDGTGGKLKTKEIGGFYTGISLTDHPGGLEAIKIKESAIGRNFDIVSIEKNFDGTEILPEKQLNSISSNGAIALINWNPDLSLNGLDKAITKGEYDNYLRSCADVLRRHKEPVLLNFQPGFDDIEKQDLGTAADFKAAWKYVYAFFNELGVSNITWVWSPQHTGAKAYYPGSDYVDWAGVSCLNYGKQLSDKNWHSFSALYDPFREDLQNLGKPVIITELGSLSGPDQSEWINRAYADIRENYLEIKSALLTDCQKTLTFRNDFTFSADFRFQKSKVFAEISKKMKEQPFLESPLLASAAKISPVKNYKSTFIKGQPGSYGLIVNNEPFYIRGVAYNTAHDWRDGNMPLTRRRVEKDFERIRAMGANTIRRYDNGIYDRNVLNLASEYDLKVLFGFWFDPEVDYYKDSAKVKAYFENAEEKVKAYKDHPALLAWSLGNETWGLLKHHYSKPYLTKVRRQYVKFIELLTQRIHEIDPNHPVFSCMEHELYQLPGELAAFHDDAPSLDAIGINSYYKEQISKLGQVTAKFDPGRPYLVSEFGPRGYWDPAFNRTEEGTLIEDTETEKAEWYKQQWSNFVEKQKGSNIGGFAYCWHDRMEGSYTWFGLTDYKGRAKPSYYGLKSLWTDKPDIDALPDFNICAMDKIVPGKTCEFKVISRGFKKDLHYEWLLMKNDYTEAATSIGESEDGKTVRILIPKQAKAYRLYLYASDDKNNVSTTSLPIMFN